MPLVHFYHLKYPSLRTMVWPRTIHKNDHVTDIIIKTAISNKNKATRSFHVIIVPLLKNELGSGME